MVVIAITVKGFQIVCQSGSCDFALFFGNLKDFVSRIFYGAGFMDADMAGGSCYNSFVGLKQGRDDRRVGLSTAY